MKENRKPSWIAMAGITWIALVVLAYFANSKSYFAGKLTVMSRFLGISP